VQTYHDMHQEIVVHKMHQITPPRGAFIDKSKSCGNPQCNKGNCRQPRHNTVGFSSATQSVTINEDAESNVRERTEQRNEFADPLLLIDEFADPLPPIERRESEQPSEQSDQSEQPSEQWPSEQSEESIPASSRTPSPPRQIAARTPSPPMVLGPQEDPIARNNLGVSKLDSTNTNKTLRVQLFAKIFLAFYNTTITIC
jgi:hypothetical protein